MVDFALGPLPPLIARLSAKCMMRKQQPMLRACAMHPAPLPPAVRRCCCGDWGRRHESNKQHMRVCHGRHCSPLFPNPAQNPRTKRRRGHNPSQVVSHCKHHSQAGGLHIAPQQAHGMSCGQSQPSRDLAKQGIKCGVKCGRIAVHCRAAATDYHDSHSA